MCAAEKGNWPSKYEDRDITQDVVKSGIMQIKILCHPPLATYLHLSNMSANSC